MTTTLLYRKCRIASCPKGETKETLEQFTKLSPKCVLTAAECFKTILISNRFQKALRLKECLNLYWLIKLFLTIT